MISIMTSAPGKIVLSGEYAVLDGASGVAMAIDRRARVRIRTTDTGYSDIAAPSYYKESGQCDLTKSPPVWIRGLESYALVDAVLRQMNAPLPSNCSIQLDTRAFVEANTGLKLGVGSSAALCVALVLGLHGDVEAVQTSFDAHREFQKGLGSGIDIACSTRGGLVRYQMQSCETVPMKWPNGLHYRVLWSGVPANTRHKIAKLAVGNGDEHASRHELFAAANQMAVCWQTEQATEVLAGYGDYLIALRQFDRDYGLNIFAAGHAEVLHAARAAGLIYKPCGAGGGDVGILLGLDGDSLDAFIAQHCGAFTVVECALDLRGAIVENDNEYRHG